MIGEKIKLIREDSDKRQQDIADILDVSRSTYAGWENGIDAIPLKKLNDFCNYYKISIDYICGLEKKKNLIIRTKEIDLNYIGKHLKYVRCKNCDTQEKVAKIIGVNQSNYSRYERGIDLIRTYPLIEFARHYDVSIDWLCGKK